MREGGPAAGEPHNRLHAELLQDGGSSVLVTAVVLRRLIRREALVRAQVDNLARYYLIIVEIRSSTASARIKVCPFELFSSA